MIKNFYMIWFKTWLHQVMTQSDDTKQLHNMMTQINDKNVLAKNVDTKWLHRLMTQSDDTKCWQKVKTQNDYPNQCK
jgi:hypothetical protein